MYIREKTSLRVLGEKHLNLGSLINAYDILAIRKRP